jgi:hypothetical protein
VALLESTRLPRAGRLTTSSDEVLTMAAARSISLSHRHKRTSRANDLLAAPQAKLSTFDPLDAEFMDFVISVRNFLGHRSTAALRQFQHSIRALASGNARFQGTVSKIGAYVKWRDSAGETRSYLIALRLIDIDNKLA